MGSFQQYYSKSANSFCVSKSTYALGMQYVKDFGSFNLNRGIVNVQMGHHQNILLWLDQNQTFQNFYTTLHWGQYFVRSEGQEVRRNFGFATFPIGPICIRFNMTYWFLTYGKSQRDYSTFFEASTKCYPPWLNRLCDGPQTQI